MRSLDRAPHHTRAGSCRWRGHMRLGPHRLPPSGYPVTPQNSPGHRLCLARGIRPGAAMCALWQLCQKRKPNRRRAGKGQRGLSRRSQAVAPISRPRWAASPRTWTVCKRSPVLGFVVGVGRAALTACDEVAKQQSVVGGSCDGGLEVRWGSGTVDRHRPPLAVSSSDRTAAHRARAASPSTAACSSSGLNLWPIRQVAPVPLSVIGPAQTGHAIVSIVPV